MPYHKSIRLRAFAGLVNKADQILIPVYFSSKGEEDDQYTWLPISKTVAKELVEHAKELGLEEIEGVTEGEGEEEGCLFLDGPGDEGEETETETETEEEEEEEKEDAEEATE